MKFLLILTCAFAYLGLCAQDFENVDVISPDASSLGKIIDTEISYSTGIPNISVPVYSIQHGPISIPIQLNYYAGGIRVTDVSNWIGLGWTLSADMMVTRVIKGIPDESDNGYFNTGHMLYTCPTQTALDLSFPMHPCLLWEIVNEFKDGQPDLFSYSFSGYSGKFYIGIGENDSLEVRQVDENDLKIEFEYDPDTLEGDRLISFVIKTPEGVKFTFGKFGNQVAIDKTDLNQAGTFTENWRVVNVSTYDQKFNVNFEYLPNNYEFYTPLRNFYTRYEVQNGNQEVNSSYNGGFNKIVYGNRLSQINYDNAEIHFIANDVRIDVGNNNKMLNEIKLERGDFCKRWVLSHDYYDSNSMASNMMRKRLRLTQLQEKVCPGADTIGNIINPYIFEYNGDFLPDLDSRDLDHWGFYNAANNPSNILNVPLDKFTFPIMGNTIIIGGANRETNVVSIDTGILIKITMPTLGTLSYEFEANDYLDQGSLTNKFCGGLRIKKLTKHDGTNTSKDIISTYTYIEDNNSSGVLFNSNGNPSNMPLYTRNFGLQMASNPCSYPCPFPGLTPGSCGTATVYVGEEDSVRPLTSFHGSHIYYKNVTETAADNSSSIYVFNAPDLPPMGPIFTFPQPPDQISLKAGLLKKDIKFEWTSSSHVMETDQGHTVHYTRSPEYFIVTKPYLLEFEGNPICNSMEFEWTIYPIFSGHAKLVQIIKTLQIVSETTNLTYDTINHLMPISEQITNSDGEVFRKEFTYAFDYPDAEIRDELIAKNIISPPFLTKEFANGVQVDGEEIEFEFFDLISGEISGTPSGSTPRLYKFYRYEKTFDLNGNLTGPGKSLQYTLPAYDGNGNVAEFMKNGWITKEFTWNNDHTLQSSQFGSHTKNFSYFPSSGFLQNFTDIDGQIVNYSYDQLLRLDSINARNGNVVTSFAYNYRSLSDPFNWTKKSTEFTPTTGSAIGVIENYKYFDGLYRPIQTVNVKASPSMNDVAFSIDYDSIGRVSKEYRPVQTVNSSGQYTTVTGDFTAFEYEPNPLSRILTTTPPSWYLSEYQYLTTSSLTNPEGTTYPAFSLRISSVTDPDGKKQETFSDKLGRVVLERMRDANSSVDTWTIFDSKSRPTRIYPPGTGIDTPELIFEFRYDGDDNLIFKKAPDAGAEEYRYDVRNLQTARRNSILQNAGKWLVTHYDDFGRPIKRGLHNTAGEPDDPETPTINTLLEEYFYDGFNGSTTNTNPINKGKLKKMRIKMLDDVVSNNTWTETEYFYDAYGRVVTEDATNHLGMMETKMYAYDFADNMTLDIHNISDPNGINHVSKHTYDHQGRVLFDIINIDGGGEKTLSSSSYNYKNELVERNLGRFANTGDHQYLQSLDFTYNPQGWLIGINDLFYEEMPIGLDPCDVEEEELIEEEELLIVTDTDAEDLFALGINYDQTIGGSGVPISRNGNITTLRWCQKNTYTQTYSLEYDFLNRVSKAVHGEIIVNDYTKLNHYYEDFEYDDRGNILYLNRKGLINRPDLNELCYQPSTIDSLTYVYSPGTNQFTQILDFAPCPDTITLPPVIDRDVTYAATEIQVNKTKILCDADVLLIVGDKISILDSLKILTSCDTPYVLIQEGPCPTNKFTEGFNHQSANGNYNYDEGGNIIYDPNKKLTFYYNHLNLPYRIVGDEDDELQFFYGSDGTLLQKAYLKSSVLQWKLDFLRGKEYRNDTLQVIYHNDGRIIKDSRALSYEYWLKDHLGNVRVTFADDNENGVITGAERRSQNNYYSFGFEHNGPWKKSESFNPKNRYKYNGKEMTEEMDLEFYDYGARWYDPIVARFISVDPMAHEREWLTPYNFVSNNPINRVDPTGAFDDWVQDVDGNIKWDENANSQETTKAGETYLGKSLTFSFNSNIDGGLWDGPGGSAPVGDKLTSTVTLTASENEAGQLTGISATSTVKIGETPVGTARDYFPGLGRDQNKFMFSQSKNADGTLSTYNLNFEQHGSVSPIEQFGLNLMGYDIVNVAQNLQFNYSGSKLSITAATDVFPSASLTMNGTQLFKYNQPSFVGTHGRDRSFIDNGRGGVDVKTTSRRPVPSFYTRYKK